MLSLILSFLVGAFALATAGLTYAFHVEYTAREALQKKYRELVSALEGSLAVAITKASKEYDKPTPELIPDNKH